MTQLTKRSHFNLNNMKDYNRVDRRLDGDGDLWCVVFEGPISCRLTVTALNLDDAVEKARLMMPCWPVRKAYPV